MNPAVQNIPEKQPPTIDPAAEIEARDRRRRVEQALAGLPAPDRRVINLRFGFDGPPLTLREIGWLLQVTAERVRQIQARAVRRLRRSARTTGLGDYAPKQEEG